MNRKLYLCDRSLEDDWRQAAGKLPAKVSEKAIGNES